MVPAVQRQLELRAEEIVDAGQLGSDHFADARDGTTCTMHLRGLWRTEPLDRYVADHTQIMVDADDVQKNTFLRDR